MSKFVKIVVFAPSSHADKIREVLSKSGCGHIGKYDHCSFSIKGFGRFRGLAGTKPFMGKSGVIEKIAEERIETICPKSELKRALIAVKKAHPYEEPAVDVYPLLNEGQL